MPCSLLSLFLHNKDGSLVQAFHMSAISMVTTAVAAVALKIKPKLKEASTTIDYQAM